MRALLLPKKKISEYATLAAVLSEHIFALQEEEEALKDFLRWKMFLLHFLLASLRVALNAVYIAARREVLTCI